MSENIQEEIEDKVIDCINSGVEGRLIIYKPEKSDFVADLAMEQRGNYKKGQIYFQINSLIGPAKEDNFIKDFPQEGFKADKNFYLLFVYFDEIKQELNDYFWLIPSVQFKDGAEVVKLSGGKKMLRFEAPLDVERGSKYSKFIVKKKDLGKIILYIFEKGGKLELEKSPYKGIEEKTIVNLENLKEFLFEARKNTYASGANPIDNPRLLSSTQLEFQRGEYFYRDIFFQGDKKFIGQEIIYQDSKPIWGMNYLGSQLGKRETVFLKTALLELVEKCRLGGSCKYEKLEFKYQDKGQGGMEEFSGQEEISLEGKNIYKLNYQGGLI